MTYIEWNKQLWDYFFKPELKNSGQKIVLAVNEDIINEIGELNNLKRPMENFITAINTGPSEFSDAFEKFTTSKKNLNILSKAKEFIEKPDFESRYGTKIPRWTKEECLNTAYLSFLVLMISDESTYWSMLNNKLNIITNGSSQKYTVDLFEHLRKWAKLKGYNFVYKNIYTKKKNVGTIFSQLPLTTEEEKQIVASLYFAKTESPDEYSVLSNNPDPDVIVEFIENQKNYLHDVTAKELNNHSSELRDIMVDYVIQNFQNYIRKVEFAEGAAMDEILQNRRVSREQIKPEYHFCIKNNRVAGVLLVNLKIIDAFKGNEIIFKNKSREYKQKTRAFENICGDNGENYRIYFLENALEKGKYSLYIDERKSGYEIEAFSVEQLNYPLWYKDFSKQDANKLKIIEVDKTLKFDINNPHKLIINQDFDGFSQEERDKYGLQSLGNNFKIEIGEDNDNKDILGLTLSGVNEDFDLGGKRIKLVNKNLEITIKGAPDGTMGKASYLTAIPITIIFNPLPVSKLELWNSENGSPLFSITDFQNHIKNTDTLCSLEYELREGNYVIKIYDNSNNSISKEFSVSNSTNRDLRLEKVLEFFVCDYTKIETGVNINQPQIVCKLVIKYQVLEELIDILIKGKKISNIYDKDFTHILEALLKKYHPELYNVEDSQWEIDLREISKKIIYLLDSLNIVEREVHYIKTIVKPYWFESGIDRRYNLVGALTLEEINRLENITSIKSNSQILYRNINSITVGFELPRLFYVEKCDEKNIPNLNNWELHRIVKKFDFSFAGKDSEIFIPGSRVLKILASNYYIPINNVEVLNWFTLKYDRVSNKLFEEMLSYYGYKLVKITNEKTYNSRKVEHYFLFKINREGINYSYYTYDERHIALRVYLNKVRYFDLTSLVMNAENDSINSLISHLLRHLMTSINHRSILNYENREGFKSVVNFQNAFSLNFDGSIKAMFIYDSSHRIYAISNAVSLPKTIEKYLVALSGELPTYKTINQKIPIKDIFELVKGNYFQERGVNYVLYQNIPEEIAFKISNSLILQLVAPGIGSAKPYTEVQLN
jgi:hypothetical protein